MTAAAPLIVRHLIQSIQPLVSFAEIEHAYACACAIVAKTEQAERQEEMTHWVAQAAADVLREYPELVEDGSPYQRLAGSIQNAYMDPAFMVGFCVAYIFATEQGGAR